MKTKRQVSINFFGMILGVIGAVLFAMTLPIEAMKMNPPTFGVWSLVVLVGDVLMPVSVVFILTGFVLASVVIIPSERKKDQLDELRLRYVLGEISKQQYEVISKDSEVSLKIVF